MEYALSKQGSSYVASFDAMASPCEVIIETNDDSIAQDIAEIAYQEVKRIEQKYSRYDADSVISYIHNCAGSEIKLDDETSKMLDFADRAYGLSDGSFDVTSGILRKIWQFDGSDNIPSRKQAKKLLDYIGWHKVSWRNPLLNLPVGMQLDLGGFGKEYACDRAIELIASKYSIPTMVNLGGDLRVTGKPLKKDYWSVGIESVTKQEQPLVFKLTQGAIATSGDTKRFLYKDGKRYSHILNPRTGFPVSGVASSITVGWNSCMEAGFLASVAILKGKDAENFLSSQQVEHLVQR